MWREVIGLNSDERLDVVLGSKRPAGRSVGDCQEEAGGQYGVLFHLALDLDLWWSVGAAVEVESWVSSLGIVAQCCQATWWW